MTNDKITIIIKQNCDISAIQSLMQQTNSSWECFILNNNVKNIEQHILGDNRFQVLKEHQIDKALSLSSGNYALFVNDKDILVGEAVDCILNAISFTNADVIKIKTEKINTYDAQNTSTKFRFKYVFNKDFILECFACDLSEFCFKKEILDASIKSDHAFLNDALTKAKDMAMIQKTCLIKQNKADISVEDIVDNYKHNHEKLPVQFWKKYFYSMTQKAIKETTTTNNKKMFLVFCKQIPLYLIPLRHRLICYLLKQTNKK